MHTVKRIIKKETVLVIATILAIVSAFFIPPSKDYISYIDFRVLGILLSLMIVMGGFQKNNLFTVIGSRLLGKTKNTIQLSLILVFLPFFFSMLITNDVALITFVPFAMLTLQQSKQEKIMIPVIVLQTIAANMGSIITPIGNPQNLYLYNLAGLGLGEFVTIMLPYTVVSAIALVVGVLIFGRGGTIDIGETDIGNIDTDFKIHTKKPDAIKNTQEMRKNLCYLAMFLLCLLVVGRMLPFGVVLALVLVVTFVMDRSVLAHVDYCLILTFLAFFIFTGNLGKMDIIRHALEQIVNGREVLTAVAASQCISNVPAALLLSGFTDNYTALLKGVNIGGLGTLIASMASLISYKIYAHNYNESKGRYLLWFTVANVFLLMILFIVCIFY